MLIFANKQDIQMSLSADEVMSLMELENITNRKWSIFACSAIKGEGNINIGFFSHNFFKFFVGSAFNHKDILFPVWNPFWSLLLF